MVLVETQSQKKEASLKAKTSLNQITKRNAARIEINTQTPLPSSIS
jgi:hypothetical protein